MRSEHQPIVVEHRDEEVHVCAECWSGCAGSIDYALWPCAIRQAEERAAVTVFGFDRERFAAVQRPEGGSFPGWVTVDADTGMYAPFGDAADSEELASHAASRLNAGGHASRIFWVGADS